MKHPLKINDVAVLASTTMFETVEHSVPGFYQLMLGLLHDYCSSVAYAIRLNPDYRIEDADVITIQNDVRREVMDAAVLMSERVDRGSDADEEAARLRFEALNASLYVQVYQAETRLVIYLGMLSRELVEATTSKPFNFVNPNTLSRLH